MGTIFFSGFVDVNNFLWVILCSGTFLNNIMVPGKLQHHFETNHSNLKEKGIEYTNYRCDELFNRHKLL